MARVNFEDDVEAQDEFWALLQLSAGDRDRALGRLVRFFRLAQKAYGHNEPMTDEFLRVRGFADMIESGWAVRVDGGFQALGARVHFAWYRQKVEAGKKGGRPSQTADNRSPHADNRSGSAANPLALALSLALAPSPALSLTKDKETGQPGPAIRLEEVNRCKTAWLETLEWAGQKRRLVRPEEEIIARAITQHGAETVELALVGARHEPTHDGWNPRNHIDIRRVLLPDKENSPRIQKFVGWGAAAQAKVAKRAQDESAVAARERAVSDEPPADPAKVREILAAAGFGGKTR